MDATFVRAQVRLATLLLEVVRPQAAVDVLQSVIDHGNVDHGEVRGLMRRLAEAQVSAVKDPTPDHYKLLGLQATCKMDELKKAYRQLAVRLHPDKAALNCPYSLSFGPSGVKVVGESKTLDTIKEEASWLFKLINEANDALTNELKRRKLERELFGDEVCFDWQLSCIAACYALSGPSSGVLGACYLNFLKPYMHAENPSANILLLLCIAPTSDVYLADLVVCRCVPAIDAS